MLTRDAPPHRLDEAPPGERTRQVPRDLVMLITPTDRHRDAARLAGAGLRVIATSHSQSTARQIMEARPAVVAVELVPSLAQDALRLLAQLSVTSRIHRVPLFVYGPGATASTQETIATLGGTWVPLLDDDRVELVTTVRRALLVQGNTPPK